MSKITKTAIVFSSVVALAAAFHANAAVKTQVVDYKIGNDTFEGFLAYDDATSGERPGVVVYHAWTGIGDNERKHAEMLAKLGYVAFVADVYGKGVHPAAPKESAAEMGKYMKDRPLLRARANAGLEQLEKNPMVDTSRLAAIGFCFGGASALELARGGANIRALAVFHASLSNPTPDDAKNIKAHVLVMQGGDDPNVPPPEVAAFEKEMRDAHVDWQLIQYGNTVHAYTDEEAGNDNSKGAAYNAESAKRSWIAMQDFFKEDLN